MAQRTAHGRHRYPKITGDWVRTTMTTGLLAAAVVALAWVHLTGLTSRQVLVLQGLAIASVVASRTAKDQLRRPGDGDGTPGGTASTSADGGATGPPATSGR